MADFAAALRAAIRRQVATTLRRERSKVLALERQLRESRSQARDRGRSLDRLEKRVAKLEIQARRLARGRPSETARIEPEAIRALRGGQSRKDFARLLGVSPGSIFGWETGRTVPRGRNVARLLSLRKKPQPKRSPRGR